MLFDKQKPEENKTLETCPYCQGKDIVKRGRREKKLETVNLYFCKKCQKKFTPAISKNKTFPLRIILDAITLYNRLNTLEESAKITGEKYGLKISAQNVKNWISGYSEYLSFLRMREFVEKKYEPKDILIESRLFHGQIYNFKYHRAKLDILFQEDFKHYKFGPLRDFLELVSAECPHQIFKESQKRASEYKNVFDLSEARVAPKSNAAIRNTRFVTQAVANNKLRHEILQQFMLVNDSVTVAVEVPVLLEKDDIIHYQNELGFQVPIELKDREVITGHIDLIQVRNGMIHIMDYKPGAAKVKPLEQLTIYALALARLTTLRLYNFKCAWFDEENYYEFYPLHVVYKKKKARKKNIRGKVVN